MRFLWPLYGCSDDASMLLLWVQVRGDCRTPEFSLVATEVLRVVLWNEARQGNMTISLFSRSL